MVESIANIVRAWPADRVRHGQPYLALELICGTAPNAGGRLEMEWSINIRCEPRSVSALDGAISAAYPDVRLGRTHGEQPRPRAGVLREPGLRDAVSQGAQLRLLADRRRRGAGVLAARADRARPGRGRRAVDRALPADPDPVVLRGARPAAVPPPREQARAPGTLGAARRRADLDVQPRRDARRRAHPEPQPVLARDGRRRRHPRRVQDGRRRGAVPPRREPPSPPLDDRPPAASTAAASRARSARSSRRSARSCRPPRSRTCSSCPRRG